MAGDLPDQDDQLGLVAAILTDHAGLLRRAKFDHWYALSGTWRDAQSGEHVRNFDAFTAGWSAALSWYIREAVAAHGQALQDVGEQLPDTGRLVPDDSPYDQQAYWFKGTDNRGNARSGSWIGDVPSFVFDRYQLGWRSLEVRASNAQGHLVGRIERRPDQEHRRTWWAESTDQAFSEDA